MAVPYHKKSFGPVSSQLKKSPCPVCYISGPVLTINNERSLNEAKTTIGLPLTMGFLNENNSLAYFAIFGELLSGLSFTVGFFKTLSFLSLSVGFFRKQGMTYLATPSCFSWLKKAKYRKRNLFGFLH